MTELSIRGIANVVANITGAQAAISEGITKAVKKAAFEIEREAKINQTPHVKTGTLRGSIKADRINDMHYEVGSTVEYAAFHEFGTRRTAAYPYLGPAADKVKAKYPNLVKEGVS